MAGTYWIDGYNVAMRRGYHAGGTLLAARERLVRELVPLKVPVRVYFDARGAPGGPPLESPSRRIELRFPRDAIADDAIVRDLQRERPANVVVVTDDRELRQRVKRLGASTLGVDKFAERLRVESGPKSEPTPRKATRRKEHLSASEVDDWMNWFGFDEEDPEGGEHPPGPRAT